jgi:hypothetical protein
MLTNRSISCKPRHHWPPPAAVRQVLRAVRRRFHAAPLTRRPNLSDPVSVVGLLAAGESIALAQNSYYPLPPEAVAWIARTPKQQRQLRRKLASAVRGATLRILHEVLTNGGQP